ncbi:MAG: hypothetical protein RMY34_29445 [Aulosira sp. DedQUE10]|nr:hypothetical protein [Aulosira sp. DedQUE10]
MSQRNEILQIFLGIFILLGLHLIAAGIIFSLGLLYGEIFGYTNYYFLTIWIIGGGGFFILQLLYVIPLCLWLRRRQRLAMMKGVIIGAVITALLNGSCFLIVFGIR